MSSRPKGVSRPKGLKRDAKFAVYCTTRQMQQWTQMAHSRDLTVPELVRELLDAALAEYEKSHAGG